MSEIVRTIKNNIPVLLRNRLLSVGLEPVLSHTEITYSIILQTIFHEY